MAFPAPERGALDNGLTLLRCHRPGQQVVAVEILLAPRWRPSRRAWTASPRSWRVPSPREPTSTPPRSSPPSWSAAAPPSTRTPTTPAYGSASKSPSPGSQALGLLADALRAPAFEDSEIERLVRNRLDEIPHERPTRPAAPPRSSPGALPGDLAHVAPAPGHRGDGHRDRLGGRTRLLREARTPRHRDRRGGRRPHRRRPRRARSGTRSAPGPVRRPRPGPFRR